MGAASAHKYRLPEQLLHELQLTCCWVTALARIWPGSILAAPAGVGAAAADTLLLCAKYLECVRHMHGRNQLLAEMYQQQQQEQQQQQQEQQQQQLRLLPLPAVDLTAAVLHTASLLLADLREHVDNNTQPDAVARLLEVGPQELQQTALLVATLFGTQLQLNLLYGLHLEERQPSQHSSSATAGGSSGSSSGNSSSSSSGSSCGSGPSTAAAARAEGVLLCRAQHYMWPQRPQMPVVQSWLQHFEASWGAATTAAAVHCSGHSSSRSSVAATAAAAHCSRH